MQKILGNVIEESGVAISDSDGNLSWRQQTLEKGADVEGRMGEEMLWELCELNFRFELRALDVRAKREVYREADTTEQAEMAIMKCFPAATGGSPLAVSFETAHQGLAACSVRERAPYFQAIRDVMLKWKGGEETLRPLTVSWEQATDVKLASLEKHVALFYVQSFFDHFARAAVIPHRLDPLPVAGSSSTH